MNTNLALKDTNVLMFDNPVKAQQELSKLISALEAVNWVMQVKLIVEATGLPLTEVLVDRSSKVPRGSLAGRLGLNDIEGFVTSKSGLSLPWAHWDQMILAYRLRELYGIHLESIKEVINEYEDVTKILGHIPANKFEYNKAKDNHFIAYKAQSEAKHQSEIDDLQDRLSVTQSSERELRMHLAERMNSITEMTAKHKQEISTIELNMEKARASAQIELAEKLENQRNDLIRSNEATIKAIHEENNAKIQQFESEKFDLIKKYNSSNYVSIDVHDSVKQQLNNEITNNKGILERLRAANERLESMQATASTSESEILMLKKTISEQSARIDALANLLKSQYGNLDIHTIAKLKEEIDKLKGYVEQFRSQKDQYKDRSLQMTARNEKLKEKLAKLSAIIEENERRKFSSMMVRMLKSALSAIGVGQSSAVKA